MFNNPNLEIVMQAASALTPYTNNARRHSNEQIRQIAKSITRFGFTNPVLVADDGGIIAGHGRVAAAKLLSMENVPTLKLSHLNADERRAYILADNKLALNAEWDEGILAIELQALIDMDFDVDLTGFSIGEIDLLLEDKILDEEADRMPPLPEGPPVSKPGDIWKLGRHRLMCGDALSAQDVSALCGGVKMDLLFADPPYNVPVHGHVSGLGQHQHREFAFASGEMDKEAFTGFLKDTLGNAAKHLKDGAIAFVCMDWRHMAEMLEAGQAVFTEMKNLCVWNKTNGGMGTFYRSKHELVFVFKNGTASHTNAFGLGEEGRYRTNVWDYAGVNAFGANRDADLAMHPTVKPVAMIADAIKDCSAQSQTVLDVFGGSGSTLIAAETCRRRAFVLELDRAYCDTIIRRFEAFTNTEAIHTESGRSFGQLVATRRTRPTVDTSELGEAS